MQVRIHFSEVKRLGGVITEHFEIDHFELPPADYATMWAVTAQEANREMRVSFMDDPLKIEYLVASRREIKNPENGTLRATLERGGAPWLQMWWDGVWHSVVPNPDITGIEVVLV